MTDTEHLLRHLINQLDELKGAAERLGMTGLSDQFTSPLQTLDEIVGRLHRVERLTIDLSATTADPELRAVFNAGFNQCKERVLHALEEPIVWASNP